MRKHAFCICENKFEDQLCGYRGADQRLRFRYRDSKAPFFLHPKFQGYCHLLWLYNPICVRPWRKPQRQRVSRRGSNITRNVVTVRHGHKKLYIQLSGIGSKLWREERFPKTAQSLFKQLMQELDIQLKDPSQCEFSAEGSRDLMGDQQKEPICDSLLVDTREKNAVLNCNVPLSGNVAPNCNIETSANVAQTCSVEKPMTVINSDSVRLAQPVSSQSENNTVNTSFTAENITESYMRSVKLATAFTPEVHAPLREEYQPVPVNNGISSGIVPVQIPAFTSKPIASRKDQSASSGAASHGIYTIINKIDRLRSGIKAIKNDKLNQMECKLNELKTTVICMIENLGTNRTYADVSKSSSSIQVNVVEQPSMGNDNSSLCVSFVDEGYGDQSGTSVNGCSSQTQLKTPYVTETTDNQQRIISKPTPQPIPVRKTNRNTPAQRHPANNMLDDASHKNQIRGNATALQKRTLIIGDSIVKGINNRG